jgi:hypothetical protein
LRRVTRRVRSARIIAAWIAFVLAIAPHIAGATPIVFRFFNLGETTAYVVQRNARTVDTESTSPDGVFDERIDAVAGDRIILTVNEDLAPPVPPLFQSAVAQGPGCVHVAWIPTGDLTVVGYVVSYGVFSVELGQSLEYQYSVEAGPVGSLDICDLPASTYYIAVRAVNYVGQLSAYSQELSVESNPTPVLISRFDARASRESVRLSWEIVTDEAIQGFRIYRGAAGAATLPLFDELLPADATTYVDSAVRSGSSYTYVLAAVKDDGSEIRSVPATATTPAFVFALEPNAPNPFHAGTRIPFSLEMASRVTLRVYDVTGALVTTLFDGVLSEGNHEVNWAGLDTAGRPVASGTYFYALTAGKHMRSRKMLLVR